MTAYIHESATPTIPAATRCDRCIAKAAVRVTFRTRGTLYFCGHHFRDHEMSLFTTALAIEDERQTPVAAISQEKAVSH